MLTLENIKSGYHGKPVLYGVDACFGDGRIVGVLGPNGSGKTTLLLTLSGVLEPMEGRVYVTGPDGTPDKDVAALPPRERARLLAAVPQRMEPVAGLAGLPVVLMGRYPYISFWGGYTETDRDRARKAMRDTDTEPFADRFVDELSGGEFQRLLLARALAQETRVLLLDESTSALDMAHKVAVFDLLRELAATGVTVIAAMHDLNLAALYCDELLFLDNGRVALHGAPAEVFTTDTLSTLYGTRIEVHPHPVTGAPQALLVPGGRSGGAGYSRPDGD